MTNGFEERLRRAIEGDDIEIPADPARVIASGRRLVRGRRIAWGAAACAAVAAGALAVPAMLSRSVPAFPAGTPSAASATPRPGQELERTGWRVTELIGAPTVEGARPLNLVLLAGTWYGYDGCNERNGTYTRAGADLTFTLGGSTLVLCTQAPVKTQADNFASALERTARTEPTNGELVLADAAGQPVLRATPDPTTLLVAESATWVLADKDASQNQDITLKVGADTLVGRTGCGDYEAPYRHDGAAWTVGEVQRSNVVPCPNTTSARSESFLGRLQAVTAIRSTATQLVLETPGGSMVLTRK